jgi:hypothetical protein
MPLLSRLFSVLNLLPSTPPAGRPGKPRGKLLANFYGEVHVTTGVAPRRLCALARAAHRLGSFARDLHWWRHGRQPRGRPDDVVLDLPLRLPETDIAGTMSLLPSLPQSGRYRAEADLRAKYEFVDDLYL